MKYVALYSDKKIDTGQLVIAAIAVLSVLTGLFVQQILSLGIIVCCLVLLFNNKLYLAFPFIIFYNSFYGLLFGVSMLRLYTLLLFFNVVLRLFAQYSIKAKCFIPLFVYAAYLILVMIPQGFSQALFILSEILCCVIVVSDLTSKTGSLEEFFKIYVVVCLCSFLTGMVSGNTIGGEYEYTRFNATFEDPNYMGFFFTIAIFALVTLRLFDKKVRYVLIVVLYAMLITSLSVTAIVVNIAVWLFYLVIMKKLKIKNVAIIALVVVCVMALFFYGLEHPNAPVVGDLSARIYSKILSFLSDDMGAVTTGRSDLLKYNFEYYMSCSAPHVLFGGIPVNSHYIQPSLHGASHNEYVDMLLNVGLIGAILMFGYFFINLYTYAKKYHESKDEKSLFLISAKVIWLCYAAALTMFLDYRFMLIFLI